MADNRVFWRTSIRGDAAYQLFGDERDFVSSFAESAAEELGGRKTNALLGDLAEVGWDLYESLIHTRGDPINKYLKFKNTMFVLGRWDKGPKLIPEKIRMMQAGVALFYAFFGINFVWTRWLAGHQDFKVFDASALAMNKKMMMKWLRNSGYEGMSLRDAITDWNMSALPVFEFKKGEIVNFDELPNDLWNQINYHANFHDYKIVQKVYFEDVPLPFHAWDRF